MRLLVGLLLFSVLWAKIVWPPPPEKARVEYVQSVERPEDLGIEKSLWEKLKDFLFGKKRETRLLKPTGVYVSDDLFVVADQGLGAIMIMNLSNEEVHIARGFPSPVDVVADPEGRIYVSDSVLGKVFVLSAEGKQIGSVGDGILIRPTGLAFDASRKRLYVVDTLTGKIHIFDPKGKKVDEITGNFNRPTYINTDTEGNLYLSDSLNARVRVLSPEGKELFSFGKRGNTIGTFANPRGIAVDRDGHIYVADSLLSAVQIFDRKGQLLLVIGRFGKKEGEFAFPMDIFIKGDRIYIADSYNARVVVLRYLGGD
jgi:DNA-binding beta-propeller fold protein YncE